LGLFLGVSVISLIEIFYYCTIRLYFNLKFKATVEPNPVLSDSREGSSWLAWASELVADYFSKTTLQGFNYMADNKRSLLERFWWLIVFVVSVFCCGSLILEVFERYDSSPIIVGFAETETPIINVCLWN
jgi:Amiloride-sensitive sodium channel